MMRERCWFGCRLWLGGCCLVCFRWQMRLGKAGDAPEDDVDAIVVIRYSEADETTTTAVRFE